MALNILAVNQAAQNLLDCICSTMNQIPSEAPGLMGCPCRVAVVPGQLVAADACGDECTEPAPGEFPGQLTVNVVRIFSSDRQNFPREVQTVRSLKQCLMPPVTAVELAVTVFRCAPGPTDGVCPPSVEDLAASALQQHADMLAVQAGILCCFAATDSNAFDGRRYVMGQSTAIGPQGLCVGFEQRVTVDLGDCIACPQAGG